MKVSFFIFNFFACLRDDRAYKYSLFIKVVQLSVVVLLMSFWSMNINAETLMANITTVGSEISRNKARLYFSQRLKQWPDGTAVTLVVLPDENPLHVSFSKKVLGLYPYQLRRAWDRQLFTGTGQAPITAANEREAREIIELTPGSLSYVSGYQGNKRIRTLEVR